jgi:hypothetical protein
MRANTTARLRSAFRVRVFAAALCAMSATASATRIFAPADGIGTAGDSMGSAVALSGDTAAVGIPQGVMTAHAAPGVIAIFRNVAGTWQREAFLGPGFPPVFALQQDMLIVGGARVTTFVRNGTTWSQHDLLDTPGSSVALSGETLLVSGSPASVYIRSNGAWTLQATLAGDQPGESIGSVALNGDTAAIVGYTESFGFVEAYVHFYHRAGITWTLESTISAGQGLEGPPQVLIAISGETALVDSVAYVRDQGTWSQQGILDPLVPYTLGSIAIDGDRAIIGSPTDSIPGVNQAGTAYVFERSGGTWSRTDHVADPDATYGAGFGTSVALEGDTMVAGSPGATTAAGQAGYASVTDLGTSPATKVATLDAGNAHANELFGTSIGASGSTLVAAAPQADIIQYVPHGAAYVFGLRSDGWTLEAELRPPTSTIYEFATSVAASADMVVVGAPLDGATGSAFLYARGDGTWPEAARLAPDDDGTFHAFGQAVVFDGDRIGVGAPRGNGTVYLYTGAGSSWPEETQLVPSISRDGDFFGNSLSLAGDTIVVGAPYADDGIEIAAGLAFVFVDSGSGWAEQAVLHLPTPIAGTGFGTSVATRGDTALIGTNYLSSGPQHVYVFQRSGTTWSLETTLDFGSSAAQNYVGAVAISPDESKIAVGVPTTQYPGAGHVFTLVRSGGSWALDKIYVDDGPGNPGGVDGFGAALAFLDESFLVGAPQDGAGGAVYQYSFGDAIFASGFDPVP